MLNEQSHKNTNCWGNCSDRLAKENWFLHATCLECIVPVQMTTTYNDVQRRTTTMLATFHQIQRYCMFELTIRTHNMLNHIKFINCSLKQSHDLGLSDVIRCYQMLSDVIRCYQGFILVSLNFQVILRAVTTRSDWQLPLALAPLREQLEMLGAKAPVSVIMECQGSEVRIETRFEYLHDGSMVLLYMVTWIPSIYSQC